MPASRLLKGIVSAALALVGVAATAGSAWAAAGVLTLGVPLEPPNLDPTSGAAAAVDEVVYGNVFEGLTRVAQNGQVAPALAESWETAPDGLSYVFRLRRGVRFHDGTSFDAQDVKFSLDRARAPGSANAQKALLEPIAEVVVLDSHTVRLNLSRPAAALPFVLGWGDAVVVAPESAATNASRPVGTGPYRFTSWRRGDSLRLDRDPNYWGPKPPVAAVLFRFISDPSAAFSALKAGDLDAFPNYPAPENVPQFRSDPRFQVVVGSTEGKMILAMNNRRAPFDDLRVRRALTHAIDRDAVIEGAMFGYGAPIGSHYSRQSPGYVDLTGLYPHDVARARALLAEAGYPSGFEAVLRLPPRAYARRSGEVIAAQLAAVGVRVRIENLEWAQWLEQVFKGRDFDLTIVDHVEPMDYDIYGREDYYFGYADREFDALLERLNAAPDEAARLRLLGDIQRKIAGDAVNVFLMQSPRIGVWRTGLSGLWINTPIAANVVSGVRFDPGETRQGRAPARATSTGSAWGVWLGLALIGALGLYAASRHGAAYLLRRLGAHAVTLLAATAVIFLLLQVVPGDPAAYMMGLNASPQSVAALRQQMGLDAPPLQRYLAWLAGLPGGNFGVSYTYQVPIGPLILERLQVSAPLAFLATALSLVAGLGVGVISAGRRGGVIDAALRTLTQVGVALPNFWIGLLLILAFAVGLRWLPAGGFPGWEAGVGVALAALILPALALAVPQAAIIARVLRAALLETMAEDYVRTARAKGLSCGQALRRHAFRNALIPVLTIIGLQFPFLLAGAILVENVFSLPGLGRLVFQAITQRDLMVVQSVVVVLVFAVVAAGLLIDLAYLAVDPRLRSRAR